MRASDVVQAVRDRHPALTPQVAPDAVVLRAVARWQRKAVQETADVRVSTLAPLVETPTIQQGLDGWVFPEGQAPLRVVSVALPATPDRPVLPLVALPFSSTMPGSEGAFPAYLLDGATLWLVGATGDWDALDVFIVRYITAGPLAVAKDATLLLPDDALDYAASFVVATVLPRAVAAGAMTPDDRDLLLAEAGAERDAWKARLQQANRGERFSIKVRQ